MLVSLRRPARASLGDPNQTTLSDPFGIYSLDDYSPPPATYPNSGGGIPTWANVANNLTDNFTRIWGAVQPVPAGCTKVRGANGQEYVSCSASGYAPQPGSALNFGGGAVGGGGGLSTIVLLGGAAVVGLLMFRGDR